MDVIPSEVRLSAFSRFYEDEHLHLQPRLRLPAELSLSRGFRGTVIADALAREPDGYGVSCKL
jgi:hypothetical protein